MLFYFVLFDKAFLFLYFQSIINIFANLLHNFFINSFIHLFIYSIIHKILSYLQALSPIKIFTVRNGIHSEFIGILPSIVQALFQSLKQPSKFFSILYSQLFDRGIGECFLYLFQPYPAVFTVSKLKLYYTNYHRMKLRISLLLSKNKISCYCSLGDYI